MNSIEVSLLKIEAINMFTVMVLMPNDCSAQFTYVSLLGEISHTGSMRVFMKSPSPPHGMTQRFLGEMRYRFWKQDVVIDCR